MAEVALVRRLEWFFRDLGYVAAKEVPVSTRLVDLYCVDPESGTTIAVEAKLSDWRRAIRQATVYKMAADFVFIALPQRAISGECMSACTAAGIGAIAVPRRGRARFVLRAPPNRAQLRRLVHRALSFVGPRIGPASMFSYQAPA